MRRLRFLQVTTFYPPYNFGGDGIHVQRLSHALADEGHHVDVVYCEDSYLLAAKPPASPPEEHPNVTRLPLRSPWSGFIGGTTRYALMVADIGRQGLLKSRGRVVSKKPTPEVRRDPYFRWSVVFWSFSPLYVLFTSWEPVYLALVLNALMLVLVPLLAIALLKLTNDKSLLGEMTNGWASNLTLATMVATAVWLMIRNFL